MQVKLLVTEETLRDICSPYGVVVDATIKRSKLDKVTTSFLLFALANLLTSNAFDTDCGLCILYDRTLRPNPVMGSWTSATQWTVSMGR